MKSLHLVLILVCATCLFPAVNPDTISNNGWARQVFTGTGPSTGGDIHWAMDTAGYAYMFGGCTYGNGAGGTHNADMYRWDLKNGTHAKIATCGSSNLGWAGGCQAGQCWDSRRNVVWYNCGFGGPCSGNCGLYKYQCPSGPITRVSSTAAGGHYYCYDPVNDKIYAPSGDWGIQVYNCQTGVWSSEIGYPFTQHMTNVAVPCCVDTKRGLYVTTLGGPYTITNPATEIVFDVCFYNGATGTWSKKTPPTHPGFYEAELAYDQVNDKYVYFGTGADGCHSEVWAYDYDSNTWSQMSPGTRAYNDANPAASTWPPGNGKHAWQYSPRVNAFAYWGGGVWIDQACSEYDEGPQPVWYYRYAKTGTKVQSRVSVPEKAPLTVSPNPFRRLIELHYAGNTAGVLNIFSLTGQTVYKKQIPGNGVIAWDPGRLGSGVYMLKITAGNREYAKKLILNR